MTFRPASHRPPPGSRRVTFPARRGVALPRKSSSARSRPTASAPSVRACSYRPRWRCYGDPRQLKWRKASRPGAWRRGGDVAAWRARRRRGARHPGAAHPARLEQALSGVDHGVLAASLASRAARARPQRMPASGAPDRDMGEWPAARGDDRRHQPAWASAAKSEGEIPVSSTGKFAGKATSATGVADQWRSTGARRRAGRRCVDQQRVAGGLQRRALCLAPPRASETGALSAAISASWRRPRARSGQRAVRGEDPALSRSVGGARRPPSLRSRRSRIRSAAAERAALQRGVSRWSRSGNPVSSKCGDAERRARRRRDHAGELAGGDGARWLRCQTGAAGVAVPLAVLEQATIAARVHQAGLRAVRADAHRPGDAPSIIAGGAGVPTRACRAPDADLRWLVPSPRWRPVRLAGMQAAGVAHGGPVVGGSLTRTGSDENRRRALASAAYAHGYACPLALRQ